MLRLPLLAAAFLVLPAAALAQPQTEPLTIGETFTLTSEVLGEERRINVYTPAAGGLKADTPLPTLYMPDGGTGEDFLHVAGLVQISVLNGTMRPFRLVGIENTERQRDLTGPTEVEEDREIAPRVGGSAAFRAFLRDELMPAIRAAYPTAPETAIIGESLAGLFVVETALLEPNLFDTAIAIDPSLWWNGGRLVDQARTLRLASSGHPAILYLATSAQPEIAAATARLASSLTAPALPRLGVLLVTHPEETHGTVYHPAALRAFRQLFAPPTE